MAAGKLGEREVPWCTVILVVGAVLSHTSILIGNVKTATAFNDIGDSSAGWSTVAVGLGYALQAELDAAMAMVGSQFVQSLAQIQNVTDILDEVLLMMGNETDNATEATTGVTMMQLHAQRDTRLKGTVGKKRTQSTQPEADTPDGSLVRLTPLILDSVDDAAQQAMQKLIDGLDDLLIKLRPALEQIGEWILKFGDKIVAGLEQFSTSLDRVQKIFDQVMAQLNGQGDNKAQMMYDTYTIFDVSTTGKVSEQDLEDLGELYGLAALQGDKPKELVDKYDADGDGEIDEVEFSMLVDDYSIPNVMPQVLRTYARYLGEISGNVAAGRMRSEVSEAVVRYFHLVVSKNLTKVGWVADRLGNGSLPLAFTSDVLIQLALLEDDPNKLTNVDTGEIVVGALYDLHPKYTMQAVDELSNTSFFIDEGFDPADQPMVMEMVTAWIATAKKKQLLQVPMNFATSLLQTKSEEHDYAHLREQFGVLNIMPAMAHRIATKALKRHRLRQQRKQAERHARLHSSRTAQMLRERLLGGRSFANDQAVASPSPAQAAIRGGQPAVPETLEFAKFLSWNASQTSQTFVDECMQYSSESSSPLDTVATQIQAMVKKMKGFIVMMQDYSTPEGIDRLDDKIKQFTENGLAQVLITVEDHIRELLDENLPIVEERILVQANETGHEVALKIAHALENPMTQMMIQPIADTLGTAIGSPELGEKLGEQIGGMLSDQMQGPLSDQLGAMLGDKFHSVTQDLLGKAADMVEEQLKKQQSSKNNANNRAKRHQSSLITVQQYHARRNATGELDETDFSDPDNGNSWQQLVVLLLSLNNAVPTAGDALKYARLQVSKISSNLDSIFGVFVEQGPKTFGSIGNTWAAIWVLYYVFFLPLNLAMLYYAFWASGWFGGPQPINEEEEELVPPTSAMDKLTACLSSCCMCCTKFHDTQICFWSCVMLMQVVVLLIFIISILLTVVAGVQDLITSGCAQLYVVNDHSVCSDALANMKGFLESFHVSHPEEDFENICSEQSLLTCELITEKLKSSSLLSVVGGFTATLLSLQMLIESASLHEMARYRRLYKAWQGDKAAN